MVQKKGATRVSEDAEEELARVPLQAILLADSFAQKFRPITLERPKVLLPLVNIPMIDYTLAWLESAGVEEVFVFCCAHSRQVTDYLTNSKWFSQPNFSIKTIESHNCVSAGDALRLIYEQHVIHGDFVLISGDTLSNMSLTQVLEEHKERRKKDSNAVMTMVIKKSKPSPLTHQSRLGTDELFMAIDPDTNQLLYYEDKADHLKGTISLDNLLLADKSSVSLHNDKQDCYIDICSPEVLSLFTDNFDYQHLRRHFVKGLLVDDIMGYKIFTHEIYSSYAARIDNFRSYDTISKDIIQRWTYPFVPDVQFIGNSSTKLERLGMYRAPGIEQSRSAQIGPFTVVGNGSTIGNNTKISNSVVGEGCNIGSKVSIEGCYIWHNVTIEDGCTLKHAIVCDGVIIKSGAVLEPGVVLSFKVVIGQQFVVPSYSKVSLLQQPTKQDSDEELEYADDSSAVVEIPSFNITSDKLSGELTSELSEPQRRAVSEVGSGGVGYMWSVGEGDYEEELRHSVAPIPADKLAEVIQAAIDDMEMSAQDGNLLPPSGELQADSNSIYSEDNIDDIRDDYIYFEKEVEATFLRAVHENIKEDHVILEVNSLRLSYNKTSVDCAGALFYSMMKLAIETPHSSAGDLINNATNVIGTWKKLLKYYLPSLDEEIEVILKFEEMCLESAREFSSIFVQVLHLLYDEEILQEDAILNWASEKEGAEEADKVFLKQSKGFIQWLIEAPEED
ncbi:Translation initiation factor eIF-2B subunit epsilon like [Actinidia chinensis var. chinensis]|uniref:Translation initiation factor eIF2B subunit epsilon n=1 Tax=Actinidia chinensis var. chinensis TaxID=1590841 RepID=A0A2R6RBE1_ACTCC|nr:Translation initiation factor eIF-2B subunit epsilon like [Actinidia chinensis var. chinensis]